VTEPMTTVAGEVVTYIHTDGLGSPVAKTDASGNVISRTRYEPYGLTAAGAVPTLGFTGHVNDQDTGLTYMQQRYYDPVAGRFLSIDPVITDMEDGDNFNRYYYANNNPYRYIDPDGREPDDAVKERIRIVSRNLDMSMVARGGGTNRQINKVLQTHAKGSIAATSNAARREVMRKEGIPTSQQPQTQSKNDSGREYTYETPKQGGGTEIKSVQQQTMDRSHEGQPHWEAGKVKTDPRTGETRMTEHGRPKLQNDKSKVDYPPQSSSTLKPPPQ